jgi:predicted chitinase
MTMKVKLDRAAFFAALRKDNSGVFNRRLSQAQVQGTEAILDSAERNGVFDTDHVAHILAEVYHETGKYMLGIKETVMPSHTDKRPSDVTVKSRLDKAFKAGKLPWVKTAYWRDGAFGRGPIQITHWSNYEKLGIALGVNLRQDPDLALDPKVGADIAVVGLKLGLFTGKRLSDYQFPKDLKAEPKWHPRRMVNGQDGTDDEIAAYHRSFYQALLAGGYKVVDEFAAVGTVTADKIKASEIKVDKITASSITASKAPATVPASKWDWIIKLIKLLGGHRV